MTMKGNTFSKAKVRPLHEQNRKGPDQSLAYSMEIPANKVTYRLEQGVEKGWTAWVRHPSEKDSVHGQKPWNLRSKSCWESNGH